MTRSMRTYDHRLRELVRQTGDVTIAMSAGVPRTRVHLVRPKVGIRTERPNEMWHLDTTVIRLVDGGTPTVLTDGGVENSSREVPNVRVGSTVMKRAA